MVRYGDPVLGWWNEAFDELIASGEFRQLCEKAQEEHGLCIPTS